MARTRRRPELQQDGKVRCRFCGGFYDPTLPECPNCGYQTEENQSYTTDWKTIGPDECAGGFGGPKSPIHITAKWLGGMLAGLLVVIAVVNIGESLWAVKQSAQTAAAVSVSSSAPAQTREETRSAPKKETAGKPDSETANTCKSIVLNQMDLTMKDGEKQKLKATVAPSDWKGTLKWSTSDPYVAWVDQKGNVTCMGGGSCNITVSAGKTKARCRVLCNDAKADHDTVDAWVAKQTDSSTETGEQRRDGNREEDKLTLNMSDMTLMRRGNAYNLLAVGGGGHYTWTSSNSSVATVNDGGVVTAVSNGTTIITCTAENGQTAECRIHVTYS